MKYLYPPEGQIKAIGAGECCMFLEPMQQPALDEFARSQKSNLSYCKMDDGTWQMAITDNIYDYPVKPAFEVGDIVVVREPWRRVCAVEQYYECGEVVSEDEHFGYQYKCWGGYKWDEDGYFPVDDEFRLTEIVPQTEYKSPVIMPKEAERLYLRIVDTDIKRIQQFTTKGCIQLGMKHMFPPSVRHDMKTQLPYLKGFCSECNHCSPRTKMPYISCPQMYPDREIEHYDTKGCQDFELRSDEDQDDYRVRLKAYWNLLSAKHKTKEVPIWDSNPYVFVHAFELVKK